ncbi:MAG TPA: aminoglycoside phosphotransferase family protein [Gaiellaceae bacterium]|nr:aminoglycoside phosphotransferase family protein [Gaiellaceae bacterium]
MLVPSGLEGWREEPGGAEWLARLPALAEELAAAWSLELGSPFEPALVSLAVPARTADGGEAVLKLNFPEAESEHEADALAHWDGAGAVRLNARDDERRALLVERCVPGDQLWTLPDEEATGIAAGVLRQLWRAPPAGHSFRPLAGEAARWAEELPLRWRRHGRPFERELLERAVGFLREAGPAQGEAVVLHQDFHGGNVLRAGPDRWLAIDPKPLVGEREFDTASFLRDRRPELARDPDAPGTVGRRLDLLAGELGLDRERMVGWGIAHALAWGLEEQRIEPAHVECARILRVFAER